MNGEESDDALLARLAAGDAAAARVLSLRLAPRVFAHAHRLLSDRAEAEDVTQEALLRLWRQAPAWRAGEAKVRTWLYRVTANLCIDRLRKLRDTGLEAAPEIADDRPGAAEAMDARARASALQAALATLPDRQRQAVVLRHLEGCDTREVARIMDIGPRAAESLIARGRRALEARLAGRREELGYGED
ncbi:RNA polymerase, sigma subunit, ECF family [Roseivivax lentus]|uniref:RNA polymerase, sigma subunit, ECF family n=1 Tax=Roseivivax lentus TaxID=633194 RepID=A0A1N7PP57_9RHOB|nr:sigma-70 family RNA polymerase sigma factor [Roseivivax lentus]SIT12342.1 RNA polymerase, sigma subunit, ECF family [Roseivivax lentus]